MITLVNKEKDLPTIDPQSALFFGNQLRAARLSALADAEAFDQIIHALERLGSFLEGKQLDLGRYRKSVTKVADESALAEAIPNQHRGLLTPFGELYTMVQNARNDALHQGAFARHLTKHAVELAIIVEDALSQEKKPLVSDFMARNPTCGELWQPVGFIRQQMLSNSFSYLPVHDIGEQSGIGRWFVISDVAVARYLRLGGSESARKKRLARPLREAYAEARFVLNEAKIVEETTELNVALGHLDTEHVLLVRDQKSGSLLGILTAFDLL